MLRKRLEKFKLSVDPAAKVASIGNCVISLWCMQTGFQISEASFMTMLRIPGFGISLAISFSTTEKSSSFSGASSRQEYWADQEKNHEVIGGMRCGPALRWVQEHLELRKAGGKRWLRFFNGKRILRDMCSEDFREWDVDKFADALVLRSLRTVPGVWRLPVLEQADDINA